MPTVLRLEEGATCRGLEAAAEGVDNWLLLMVTEDATSRSCRGLTPVRISTEDDLFRTPEDDGFRVAPPKVGACLSAILVFVYVPQNPQITVGELR